MAVSAPIAADPIHVNLKVYRNQTRTSSDEALYTHGLTAAIGVAVLGHDPKDDTQKHWLLSHIGYQSYGNQERPRNSVNEHDLEHDPEEEDECGGRQPFDEAMRRLRAFVAPLTITHALIVAPKIDCYLMPDFLEMDADQREDEFFFLGEFLTDRVPALDDELRQYCADVEVRMRNEESTSSLAVDGDGIEEDH